MNRLAQFKWSIKDALCISAGAFLCLYLIPLCVAIVLGLHAVLQSFTLMKKEVMLFVSENIVAMGAAGFLTALIVSFFSAGKEIRNSIIALLPSMIFYSWSKSIHISALPQFYKARWIAEIITANVFLVCFAVLGAWLIKKKLSSKNAVNETNLATSNVDD